MAAASLTDAFAELELAFEESHPTYDIRLNLAGSSSLREQILEGAPADVFASANEATMTQVAEAAGLAQEPAVFAHNRMVIAVPLGNPGEVHSLADLGASGLLVGLCTVGVPCGDLARELLRAAGVNAAVDTNEPDVRALLTKIAADELDAGIVYRTDVEASTEVEAIDFEASDQAQAAYPIATLAEATNVDGGDDFVQYVLSDAGQTILRMHGFLAP